MQVSARADSKEVSYFSPVALKRLWQVVNAPQPVDGQAVRTISLLVLIFYVLSSVARFDSNQLRPLYGQAVVILTFLFGSLYGLRFDWKLLRFYTLLIALVLPCMTVFNVTARGASNADVVLVAVATFAGMLGLQSGVDVALAVGFLSAAGLAWLLAGDPFGGPRVATGIALGTAMMAGVVTVLTRIAHQSRVTESMISLERALNARSEFVNTMSHELRSPLNVIIGYADMLSTEGAAETMFMAARIRANALELLQLVENTMSASRLGSGKVTVHTSEFSLGDLIGDLRESTQVLPRQGDVSVVWDVEEGLPWVRSDRLKLKEIILNLVSNALKFTPAGSVTVRLRREHEWLRIEVEDTGVGIPTHGLERIFGMFERVEPRTEVQGGGVGLGLYIVKSLVELMDGNVDVRSEVGRGSCFTVRVPYA